jgi:hypothetical protein
MVRQSLLLWSVVLLLAAPSVALASGSLRCPVGESPRVLLGYGDTYAEGGASRVHRGADLAASAGASVRCAADGVVTFAGQVPSAESSRGTLAVTVKGADGLRVTYMPLASVGVPVGAALDTGEAVGTLAASGDGSVGQPHLHLSVRNGDAYLDPVAMLSAAAPPPAPETPVQKPATKRASQPTPKPAAVPAASPAPVAVQSPALSGARVPQARSVQAPQADPQVSPAGATRTSATTARTSTRASIRTATSAGSAVTPASAFRSLQRLAAWIAELLVAVAFLWPAWRRMSRFEPEATAEVVPVEAER